MIAFQRTATIQPGKTSSAIAFAHEIAAYMKDAYAVDLEVLMAVGGNPADLTWATHYKDLAAFESVSNRTLADKKYWDIVNKSADNFIAGSLHDALWRSV